MQEAEPILSSSSSSFVSSDKQLKSEEFKKRILENISRVFPSTSSKKLIRLKDRKEKQRAIRFVKRETIKQLFYENEAELGSDNEDHDDVKKEIVSSDEEESFDFEQELEGFIDEARLESAEAGALIENYYCAIMKKDKEEIRRIISGPKRRKREFVFGNEEGDLSLEKRKELKTERIEVQAFESYLNKKRRQQIEEEVNENGDWNEIKQQQEKAKIEKSYKSSLQAKIDFQARNQHISEVLKDFSEKEVKDEAKLPSRLGKAFAPMNSLLYAIKNDKFFLAEDEKKEERRPASGLSILLGMRNRKAMSPEKTKRIQDSIFSSGKK